MINRTVKSLGLTIALLVPATVEEYDKLAGKTGACLDSAVANEIYRGFLADFRSEFCAKVESVFNIPRKTKLTGKKKKDADGNETDGVVFDESESDYIGRVLAQLAKDQGVPVLDPNIAFADVLNGLLTETEEIDNVDGTTTTQLKLRFDPIRAERKERGPKKLPDVYLKAAQQVTNLGKSDRFIAKYGVVIPDGATAEQKTEAIGWKMKALEDAERKAQEAKLASKYADEDESGTAGNGSVVDESTLPA